MSIVVTCQCGKKLAAPPSLAGRRVKCPVCGQAVQVPQAGKPASAAPAAKATGDKIVVACACGQRFAAESRLAGQQLPCPVCGRTLLVQPAAAPAAPAAGPLGGGPLDDPLWSDLGAMVASAPAAPTTLSSAPAPYVRRQPSRPFNAKPFIVGCVILAVVLLMLGLGYGGYLVVRAIAKGANERWEEHTSTAGRFAVLLPKRGFTRTINEDRPIPGSAQKAKIEGVRLGDGREAGVCFGDLPMAVPADMFLNLTVQEMQKQIQVRQSRDVTVLGYPAKELEYDIKGRTALTRLVLVRTRLYEITWGAKEGKLNRDEAQKFFDSFRLLDESPPAAKVAAAPAGAVPPGGAPAAAAAANDYATARRSFQTKLTRRGPPPQESEPLRTPPGATRLDYTSGGVKLAAFVSTAPAGGGKRPGLLFLHGGFAFGDGDWEMAQPYRDAGYVVMLPTLRGENGQPGHFTLYFDEVDDVLAATDALAALPSVDGARIFVAGHSAGGTLATLAAMTSNRFRAAASLGGCMDLRLNADIAPFDPKDDGEFRIRSPLDFAGSFQCPARLYYGNTEVLLAEAIRRTAAQAKQRSLDVEAVSVPGDHMTAAEPGIRQSLTFFLQRGGADPATAAKSPATPATSTAPAPGFPPPPQPPGLPPSIRPPPPSAPGIPGMPGLPGSTPPAAAASSGAVVVCQILSYNGSQDAATAARQVLAGLPWVDLSRFQYDAASNTLTVGLRGSAVSAAPVRAALQSAGFRIGATSVRRTGQ